MKVFVSAAEISSDIHAEKILRALQKKAAEQNLPFEVRGIGGPRLRSIPGFVPVENAENLRTMGFIEVLRKWTYFTNLISITAEQIHGFQPDLILTFDYPDFHFKLMETLQKRNIASQAVRICGIPPKVWVWRSKRVEKIRNLYHGVWVIFPFEKIFYQERGIPVIFEGNPLLEDLPLIQLTSVQKRPLETITVMPGSREGELDCHLPVIPEALELFSKKIAKPVIAMVPVPEGVDQKRLEQNLLNTDHVSYVFSKNDSARCLLETSIGLIKSGTSTLEASVLDCVPVIFYRMNWFSEKIFNFLIRGIGGYLGPVGLPNILLGIKKRDQSPFREFLGVEATPDAISNHLAKLYRDEEYRQSLEQKCGEVRALFLIRDGASSAAERSSSEILKWMQKKPHTVFFRKPKKRILYTLVSLIWSTLNFFRRRIQLFGLTRSHVVKTPSILVGNIQAGGAGKTPLIIALARAAVAKGKKVAVITSPRKSKLRFLKSFSKSVPTGFNRFNRRNRRKSI